MHVSRSVAIVLCMGSAVYSYSHLALDIKTVDMRAYTLQTRYKYASHTLVIDWPYAGHTLVLKVIYHPLYSINNFVTYKSKLPQDGAQVFPYMG